MLEAARDGFLSRDDAAWFTGLPTDNAKGNIESTQMPIDGRERYAEMRSDLQRTQSLVNVQSPEFLRVPIHTFSLSHAESKCPTP